MFERFTESARRVIVAAHAEARLLNHNYVGTEHLLLGLLADPATVAARALASLGVSPSSVRTEVEDMISSDFPASTGNIPFTPRAKHVLELSLREAKTSRQEHIGTGHILLGLVGEGGGVGAQVLVRLGTDMAVVRQKVVDTPSEEP